MSSTVEDTEDVGGNDLDTRGDDLKSQHQLTQSPTNNLRVAVEGCGHGTLHAIYASIEEACQAKGWDGVDLVIIGGDFQAVRNKYDLNVTAMPQKYRKMADFHEYYSGTRTAPYLTVFIGGNHEASNHLFELYYGGWVAPNIYYLGAANVLRLGSLRIAGLSGIWKGYDYRKPHFERLPYNDEDMTSIFHVRELDVRKLLSVRTQIDIGLSHDWPKGIEWHGDHEWLFRIKRGFEQDAQNGQLGSTAAQYVFDRLRPSRWFSAHLHVRYPAVVDHGDYDGKALAETTTQNTEGPGASASTSAPSQQYQGYQPPTRDASNLGDQPQIRAWQGFGSQEAVNAKAEQAARTRDLENRRLAEAGTEEKQNQGYSFDEIFKKVSVDENNKRKVGNAEGAEDAPHTPKLMPLLDGCGSSRESPTAKRQRTDAGTPTPTSVTVPVPHTQSPVYRPPQVLRQTQVNNEPQVDHETDIDGEVVCSGAPVTKRESRLTHQSRFNGYSSEQFNPLHNADAIDLDSSSEEGTKTPQADLSLENRNFAAANLHAMTVGAVNGASHASEVQSQVESSVNEGSSGVSMTIRDPQTAQPADTATIAAVLRDRPTIVTPDTIMIEPQQRAAIEAAEGTSVASTLSGAAEVFTSTTSDAAATESIAPAAPVIPEELRAELAALSSNFSDAQVEVSPDLPFPEAITNRVTHFLALDKCEPHRHFLQLLELDSISSPDMPFERPLKLQYDPEWLAILRVFAPELSLGGQANGKVPKHRGETYYRERIIEEEVWIEENVVKTGKLDVPENFTVTAPVYDEDVEVEVKQMPREVTNSQTVNFCQLIGIECPFEASEEDRSARMEAGPREGSGWRGGRGGGRGRGRGGRGDRGGRGGRGRGGRGRGRGGRW